jgi:hypothetical protein
MKREKLPPHRWRYISRDAVYVFPLVLERAHLKHEIDTVWRSATSVGGTLAECRECGCLALWGHYVDLAGQRQEVSLFGIELESMTPCRTPGCERLSRPDVDNQADELAVPDLHQAMVDLFARCA